MSFNDFFDEEEEKNQSKTIIKKLEIHDTKEEIPVKRNVINTPTEEIKIIQLELGVDVSDVLLLDVKYEPKENLAQCIFYHEETRSLYRWNDNTNHKPYLITDISKETLMSYEKLVNSQEFVSIEEIEKLDLLTGKMNKYSQIFGKTPLSIGGAPQSMRNIISPAYEADIRYHLNYISDRGLTPGTYYNVISGQLVPKKMNIPKEIKKELDNSFKGEHSERLDMMNEYMPLLFQPIPDILRCAFDIEVGSEKSKMPNTSNPLEPIISIALADTDGRKICWVLNRDTIKQKSEIKSIEIRKFDSELELIDDFLSILVSYPVILSFNGDSFDAPYLVNRALKLGMEKVDIPIILRRREASFSTGIHLDLLQFFKQASIRLYAFSGKYESASLDSLSKSLLGKGKLEHPDTWINEMDFETLVKYNVLDAELTLQLSQFDNQIVMNLIFIIMRITKMPIYDVTRSPVSRWLHMWLVYEHRKRNYLIPRKEDILMSKGSVAASDAIIDGKKFQGAIVLDPHPGIWWNVHVLDFASLYPSIIKTKNLSYETIRCEHPECKSNLVPEVNHWICLKKEGLFSVLFGFVRDTRVKWFKPRAGKSNPDEDDRRNNNVIQSSLKVLINAGYGVIGSEAFDFYCPPVAESTTAFAREAIMEIRNYIQDQMNVKVIYGDTDSVFLYDPTPEQIIKVIDWGTTNIGIELGIDYEFRYVVFSDRKKNYFGITKEGVAVVKGLMAKKSNTPLIIRNTFTKMLDILKQVYNLDQLENAKSEIRSILNDMISTLKSGEFSVEDISIRITLSRKLKEYTTWTPAVQAVAQLISANIRVIEEFHQGDRIEFIKSAVPIKVRIPNGFAFPVNEIRQASVIPIELINKSKKISGTPTISTAESTFSQILESLDISWDRIMGKTSLDDFF